MTKILLITITGHDKPGLTSAFAQTLAESNATLLDIGQAVIHDALALGLMVKANPSSSIKIVEAKIQEKARELGVTARLSHVSETEYRDWVKKQHKQRFIVTLLSPWTGCRRALLPATNASRACASSSQSQEIR